MVNHTYVWPPAVTDNVTAIRGSLQTLASLINVCQDEGIRRQNYKIIIDLLPRLIDEVALIYQNSLDIRAAAPRRRGRPQKWVTVTEEITALSITMIDASAEIEQHIPGNYWSTIALLLSIIGRNTTQIGREMAQITLDNVPAVFQEALDD